MKSSKTIGAVILTAAIAISATAVISSKASKASPAIVAGDYVNSLTAALGYDVVSYHATGGPSRGSGDHVAIHEGVTYLFENRANRKQFEKNPSRYVPAYGGYCAYGVSVGKKFIGDPEVWGLVDDKLYLNLNRDVQKIWNEDTAGKIQEADQNWPQIREKAPHDL